jgi:hypothetical protein
MKEFELTGFVNFPNPYSKNVKKMETGKTYVYLVAIDFESDMFSKIHLDTGGKYIGDDVSPKRHVDTTQVTIEELIDIMKTEENFEINLNKNFVSTILLGWSNYSYQIKNDIQPWICSFRDLTNEGRKLYYSMKKLHCDKDVRLITFNNI